MIPDLIKIKGKYFYKTIMIPKEYMGMMRGIIKTFGRYDDLLDELTVEIFEGIINNEDITGLKMLRISHMASINAGKSRTWNKGLTKETNDSLRKISEDMKGINNPVHSIADKMTWRNKISIGVHKAILEDRFTPKSNNRLTHADIIYNDKIYRSTWECVWAYYNPSHLYETIRIKYTDINGIERVTILDFYDEKSNTVYEIKPITECNKPIITHKIKEIKKFCNDNCYNFKLITDDEIMELCYNLKDFSKFNEKATRIIKRYINVEIRRIDKINENKIY